MGSSAWLFFLTMWTLANSLAALLALAALKRALRSTLNPRNLNSVKQDFAQLESDFGRLFDMVKRLSQRQSLADHKAGRRAAEEPESDNAKLTKDELRKKFLHNRTHTEIARLAMKGRVQ